MSPPLVRPGERAPEVARFTEPLADPNLEDAHIGHALAPIAGLPLLGRIEASYRRKLRLKRWHYATAVSDELFLAFVVGTAGFAGNGFVYAVELATGKLHKKLAITPLGIGAHVAPTSVAGNHRFTARGLDIAITNRVRGFGATIHAATDAGGRLDATLDFGSRADDDHLALCVPLAGGRWNYTHKHMALAVSGEVTLGANRYQFSPGAWGTMDFTKMYALRHAVWRWVALCGRSRQGAVIGLNLVDPTPNAPVSENTAWIDGKLEPIADVRLDVDAPTIDAKWRIAAASVDLASRSVAHFEQVLDVPLVKHRLRHIVSAFSGRVRTRSGHIHDLESVIGIAEDNDTWW
jgi:hypothetical protein